MGGAQSPMAERQRSIWVRLGIRFVQALALFVLAVIALIVGYVHSQDFQRRTTGLIETLIEGQSGEQVTLTRVTVRFWPPGVDVDGFHLFHDPTGETIVSAERIRVPIVLRAGKPQIGKLQLQRPLVHVHMEKDGKLREFRNLVRPADPKPLQELPWGGLEIVDGHIQFDHPRGTVQWTKIHTTPVRGTVTDLTSELLVRMDEFERTTALDVKDLVLGPKTIEIPNLDIQHPILTLAGQATIPLEGDLDVNLTGQVQLEELNPALVAPRRLHGAVDFDFHAEGPMKDPTLSLAALGSHLSAEVPGVFTPVLHYELGQIDAAVVAHKDSVRVDRLAIHWLDGTLTASATLDPKSLTLSDGLLIGDRVSLAHALKSFDAAPTPWVDMNADAEIRFDGTLKPLKLEGDFELAVAKLRVGNAPIADPDTELMLDFPHAWARGKLLLEKDHIFLDAPTIEGPNTRGEATIDIGFGPRGPLDLRADVWGADLSDFQPLAGTRMTGKGRVAGRIHGPFNKLRFDGMGDVTGFSVLGIPWADRLEAPVFRSPDMKSLEFVGAKATLGQSSYQGDFKLDFKSPFSMDAEILMPAGRIEDASGMFIDLPGMRGDLRGTLSLHGPVYDMDGEAHLTMSNIDLWGERFEIGEAHGFMDQGLFTLDDLRVLRNDRQEGIRLRGSVERDWALNMELLADGLKLATLDTLAGSELPLHGKLGGYARIDNTLFDPSPHGRLTMTDVRYNGKPVDDSVVRFETADGVMRYRGGIFGAAAKVDGTLGLWGEQPYAMTIDLDQVPAHVLIGAAADGGEIRAVGSGNMRLAGHFGEQWSPVDLDLTLDTVAIDWSNHHLRNTATWHYKQNGRFFQIDDFGLRDGITDFTISASGGDGLVLGGDGVIDLDLLRAVVPGLTRSEGEAVFSLTATGQRPNVDARIDLEIDADLMRHTSVPSAFEDLRASATLTEEEFVITGVQGGLGGGTIIGGGTIATENWVPTRWNLDGNVEDAQMQWVDSLPPAIGNATLSFDGPTDALLLSGDIDVTAMDFTDRIDWEDWVVEYREEVLVESSVDYDEPPWFSLNLHILADKTIQLQNNVADGLASADLRIIGDTTRPGLVGNVNIEYGVAFLQDREFRIDRGLMTFNDPWSWDPDLDFDLLTDITSRDRRFRVNYLIFGPFSDWRTATRSDPPLPQADVNALLWFGVTTEDLEQMGELPSAVAQGVADLVLTDLFTATQASELGEVPDLLFDRIDVATGVNGRGEYSPEPRLVVEKRLDDLGGVELTWEFNLSRPEDNYLRAEQRIGGIWSIAGWYATLQRDRVLPIGGAYGVDVTARWESE